MIEFVAGMFFMALCVAAALFAFAYKLYQSW